MSPPRDTPHFETGRRRFESLEQGVVLRGILETVMDAVVIVDEAQRILFFNRAAELVFGYARDEVIGSALESLMPERFRDGHRGHMRAFGAAPAAAPRRMGADRVVAARRRSGEEFPITVSISTFNVAGSRFQTAIIRDVSAQVRAWEALERSNRDLQQFAFAASHDLKTPLRAIAGFVELLGREYGDTLDAKAADYIARASAATHRLEKLVDSLLFYARQRKGLVRRLTVECRSIVEEVLGLLDRAIRESGAIISVGSLPTIQADPDQVTHLFLNLVGNAIKYRGADPPRISVSATAQGSNWLFAVEDNGIGIDGRHHQRIFEFFRRLHTDTAYDGTGIGLAICQQIVEQMGGRIWVESEPGRGSTFFFTVPWNG